jgi:hypothetical protein
MFSVILYMLRQTVGRRASPLPFPSFSPLTVTFPKLGVILRLLYCSSHGLPPSFPYLRRVVVVTATLLHKKSCDGSLLSANWRYRCIDIYTRVSYLNPLDATNEILCSEYIAASTLRLIISHQILMTSLGTCRYVQYMRLSRMTIRPVNYHGKIKQSTFSKLNSACEESTFFLQR